MKRVVSSLIVAGSLLSATASTEIMAVKYSGDLNKIDSNSKVWKMATFTEVLAYPQTTIKMNDKIANKSNSDNSAKRIKVAALYNDKNIAFKVEWADGSKNVFTSNATDSYADGFAIQLPQNFSNPEALPYIGMGSKDRNVVIHINKAYENGVYEPNGNGDVAHQVNRDNTNYFEKDLEKFDNKVKSLATDYQRTFIGEGFRSMTEARDVKFNTSMSYSENKWSATLTRDMKDSYLNLSAGAFPVAFAVWDGHKLNRDGLKHLTSWIGVKLIGKSGGEDLIKSVNHQSEGDINSGKEQFVANCAACHNINSETDMAPAYMAPNLSNIGGYALASYLEESLKNPSAVVVPGYNRNAHKAYEWYTVDDKGNRTSTMPAYDWMDAKTISDIVAYLQTLKAEVK